MAAPSFKPSLKPLLLILQLIGFAFRLELWQRYAFQILSTLLVDNHLDFSKSLGRRRQKVSYLFNELEDLIFFPLKPSRAQYPHSCHRGPRELYE